jgi:putative flippase GtrA
VKRLRQLLTAGLGGAIGTSIDFAVLVLLVERVGLSIPLSAFLAANSGAVVCFLLNKHLAFRDRTPITLRLVARFGLVVVAAALLMALMMRIVAVDLRVPYLAAKLLCAALVFLIWTYPAQRRLVFTRRVQPAA